MKRKCKICGAPCKSKYCKACAKRAYRENEKMKRQAKAKPKYHGCDEDDCEHCPYPDCLKPVSQMSPLRDIGLSNKITTAESQAKMYTVELGGFGGARPNLSRKFYL